MDSIEMLVNRLRKRRRHLRKWARRRGISCYRVYERDLPDQPLIADWYDGDLVAWTLGRKRDETPEQNDAWVAAVRGALLEAFEIPPQHLFLKERSRQRGAAQYERAAREHAVRVVEEGGLRFEVNLSDFVDTGLFLDHRDTRAMVRDLSPGARFLNLFAYTGSFTCYAAAGGASSTLSIDLSSTYCGWAERNLALNGHEVGDKHRIRAEDCVEFLEDAGRETRRFDLIVCDPPTFSNSKRMRAGSFAVGRDHPFVLRACAELLAPGGTLFFSTNDRRFHLDEDALAGMKLKELTPATIPDDFRNRRIHRCWRMHAT